MPKLDELQFSIQVDGAQTPQMIVAGAYTTRLMCHFMFSSESKKTHRSRTTADGDIILDPTRMSWSANVLFLRFVADPNHITLVFFVLS